MHRLKDMRYFRKNTLGQRLRYNNAVCEDEEETAKAIKKELSAY